MDIEKVISSANNSKQTGDAGLGNGSRVCMSIYFFDDIHRNIEQDFQGNRLGNVRVIFRAFPDLKNNTSHENYHAFHTPGLGSLFNETPVENSIPYLIDQGNYATQYPLII
ncbi:hypothetical protein QFJ66_23685 [Raoultella terrigena]|uniref:hypothetical protein n=1 Tax=Raoultella terrigena TaxID=577 RepID=UPI002F94956E